MDETRKYMVKITRPDECGDCEKHFPTECDGCPIPKKLIGAVTERIPEVFAEMQALAQASDNIGKAIIDLTNPMEWMSPKASEVGDYDVRIQLPKAFVEKVVPALAIEGVNHEEALSDIMKALTRYAVMEIIEGLSDIICAEESFVPGNATIH